MASTTVLVNIAIVIVSLLGGIVTFYIISHDAKEIKKKQIEDVVSLAINFVIYIWIGKIIVNFDKFISDPLAILAYPSSSYAFYLATIFIIVNLYYRKYRHSERINLIVQAFIPIILSASFIYEFLQVTIENQPYNKSYLLFITVLTIGYIALYGRMSPSMQSFLFSLVLLLGQLLLTLLYKITIFGYRLLPIYFISLIVIIIAITTFRKKRKV